MFLLSIANQFLILNSRTMFVSQEVCVYTSEGARKVCVGCVHAVHFLAHAADVECYVQNVCSLTNPHKDTYGLKFKWVPW